MTSTPITWRKSTHSSADSACVEMARLPDGTVLVRNSNHRDAGTVAFTPTEMHAWLAGVKAGEFDDMS
jgi:hypothetical protein